MLQNYSEILPGSWSSILLLEDSVDTNVLKKTIEIIYLIYFEEFFGAVEPESIEAAVDASGTVI